MGARADGSALRIVIVAAVAIGVAYFAMTQDIAARQPAPDLQKYGSVLATLLFASAILERALDVVLSLVFGGEADRMDGEIRTLKLRLAAQPDVKADEKTLGELLGARTAWSARTRKWALPIAVSAGLVVSAVGLRSLEPLFEVSKSARSFVFVDVILTGMLLAGGSDGIHWLVALYRDWIDKNRSTRS